MTRLHRAAGVCATCVLLMLAALTSVASAQEVIFVNGADPKGGDGFSWDEPLIHLSDALSLAAAIGADDVLVQVWVAQGVYHTDRSGQFPAGSGDPSATFFIAGNVEVYGGFVGGEKTLDERDFEKNLTFLDGTLNPQFGGNANHVVTIDSHIVLKKGEPLPASPRLDGFTVRNGLAIVFDDKVPHRGFGGGINIGFPFATDGEPLNPIVANCSFVNNSAMHTEGGTACGGGAYIGAGEPTFINCTFDDNFVPNGSGGGACVEQHVWGVSSPPTAAFIDCTWFDNSASATVSPGGGGALAVRDGSVTLSGGLFDLNNTDLMGDGGAIYVGSGTTLEVSDATFHENFASFAGGAIGNRGNLDVQRCIFEANESDGGGAIADLGGTTKVINSLFFHNFAFGGGGAILGSDLSIINSTIANNSALTGFGVLGAGSISNSIFWFNTGEDGNQIDGTFNVSFSNVQGGHPGPGNINVNPLFVNVLEGNYRLLSGSPSVDTGSNDAVPEGVTTDLDGNPRIVDGIGDGIAVVDMGAYEAEEAAPPPIPTWISASSGSVDDPSNWVDGLTPGFGDPMIFGLEPSDAIFTVSFTNFADTYGSVTVRNQRPIFDLFGLDNEKGLFVEGLSVGGMADTAAPAELRVVGRPLTAQQIALGGPLGTNKGTLNLQPNSPLSSYANFEIARTGVVVGNGSLQPGDSLVNRGIIAPGVGGPRPFPGIISIEGGFGYTQHATGSLRIDIAGPPDLGGPGASNDHLHVEQEATLGGTLIVDLLGEFVPSIGDTYEVLSAQSLNPNSPTFHSVYMPALPDGLVMTVEYVFGDDKDGAGVFLHVSTLDNLISFGTPSQFDAGGSGVPAGLVVADLLDAPCPRPSRPGCVIKANDMVTLLRSANPAIPGSAFVLVNTKGDATEFAALQLTVGLDPRDLLVADLTRNGSNDIAVVNAGSGTVSIWYNDLDGKGGFTPNDKELHVGGSPVAIVAGNFRGLFIDGQPILDLAVLTRSPDALVELQNDGEGNFVVLDPVPLDAPPTALVSADFNHDGLDDIALGDDEGDVSIFPSIAGPGAAGGSFANNPSQRTSTLLPIVGMDVEDFDNTKDQDIIVGGASAGALGAGGPAGETPGDGALSILINNGFGVFSDPLTVELDGPSRSLTVWDINDTSKPDIAVVVEDPNVGPVIRVFRNDFDSEQMLLVFSLEPQMFGVGKEPVFVRHGDMNGSGQQDMLSLNSSGLPGGNGRPGGPAGDAPATVSIWPNTSGPAAPPEPGCVKSHGFWKNHPGAWPVDELSLGSVTYTKAQLIAILKEPVKGNGLLILSKQLIAAKLNIANGALAPQQVVAIIQASDMLIGGAVVPPIGNGYVHPSIASPLAEVLAQFNEGTAANGPPPCP